MPDGMRRVGIAALLVALLAWAYGPLLTSGAAGADLELLAGLRGRGPGALYPVPGLGARPLAALSLFLDRGLFNPDKAWSAGEVALVRLENLLWLVALAAGLRVAVQRAVEPFLGNEVARSAAWATAVLLLLHPLAVSAVGHVASRGDLLGLALGAWSCVLFLFGRQERDRRRLLQAFGLAFLASLATRWALALPFVLAGAEFLSARRHRRTTIRTNTTITTFLTAALVVSVEWLGRTRWAPEHERAFLRLDEGALHPAALLGEFGTALLPVDEFGIGLVGYVFAFVALALVLHPAFLAGRGAPRLWGRLLCGWLASLLLVTIFHDGGRVVPGHLAAAPGMIGAAVVLAVGFGLASTAISGSRRFVLPALAAFLFALLGRGVSAPIARAGSEADALRDRLHQATAQQPPRPVLTIGVPRRVAGVTVFRGPLIDLLSPRLQPERREGPELEVPWIGRTDARGFGQWLAEPEGRAFVRAPFASLRWATPGRPVVLHDGRLPEERHRSWSPTDVTAGCDPATSLFLEVVGTPAEGSGPPRLIAPSLRPGEEGHEEVKVFTGVWVERGPGESARAWFDLESDPDWLLFWGGSVEVEPDDFASAVAFHAHVAPPRLEGVGDPEPVGGDWVFDAPPALPSSPDGDAELVLWLLALDTLERREVPVLRRADGRLVAPRAGWIRGRLGASNPGRLIWGLDLRVGEVTVARARGRR